MLSKPSISIRRGIAWGYEAAEEPIDRLVLTARSSKFVDVRFPKQWDDHLSLQPNPLFRAFTGTIETSFLGEGKSHGLDFVEMPYTAHRVRKHEIDTRPTEVTDEADIFLLPQGDHMEIGAMENPITKRVEPYKAYWTGAPAVNGETEAKKIPCVVAELAESTRGPRRGRIIRIGDYCQAIEECPGPAGANVIVARYTREASSEDGDDDEEWIEDERNRLTSIRNDDEAIFAQLMPALWVCEDERKLGDRLQNGPDTWDIVEADN